MCDHAAMKKIFPILVVAVAVYAYDAYRDLSAPVSVPGAGVPPSALSAAFAERKSDVQVRGEGHVLRVLRDDLQGSRHQKFILRLADGQTVLVSHNIDLAPRVAGLSAGDRVEFFGEYEWNDKGGVIHWTHHDPAGRHVGGWLRHRGVTYQ